MKNEDIKKEALKRLAEIMPQNEAQSEFNFIIKEEFNISPKDLILNPKQLENHKKQLEEIINTRVNERKPLQYILNKAAFCGEMFYVDENVLIPRPETEILVDEIIKRANSYTKILDIGTGSGCIALMLAKLLKNNNICASDISKKALLTAQKNAQKVCPEQKINFILSDLFENINEKFDIIVSNPPYIKEELKSGMQPEVLDYEPHGALFAEDEGMYFYKKIIKHAPNYLNNGGIIAFEAGINQAQKIEKLLENEGFSKIIIIPDFSLIDRIVLACYNF